MRVTLSRRVFLRVSHHSPVVPRLLSRLIIAVYNLLQKFNCFNRNRSNICKRVFKGEENSELSLEKKEIKKKTGKKVVTKEIKKEIFHLVPPSAQAAPPARYGFVSFYSDTEKYSSASVSAHFFFVVFFLYTSTGCGGFKVPVDPADSTLDNRMVLFSNVVYHLIQILLCQKKITV